MDNYTKVSDKLVAKYGVKVAYIYAKLVYRMKLSVKTYNIGNKYFYKNGFFIIYKVNDLAKDCNMSRNVIINALKKLEKANLIYKDRTMFCTHIYLPKFDSYGANSNHKTHESHKHKLSKKQRANNKNNNNVSSSSVNSVKRYRKYPRLSTIVKRYGIKLVRYAFKIYHQEVDKGNKIHSSEHFVVGVLRRWRNKHIKTVNEAMKSEHDKHYVSPKVADGPEIPIFNICG